MVDHRFVFSKEDIKGLKSADKKIAQLIETVGEINRHGFKDPFIGLLNCIVYQQISFKAANHIWSNLLELWSLKTVEQLNQFSEHDLKDCGLSRYKIKYIKGMTQGFLDGRIQLKGLYNKTNDQVIKELTQIKGIGYWSAEMFLIFTLNRKNVMSYKDLGIRRGLRWLYGHKSELSEKAFQSYYDRFSPYNTLASFYLWEITLRNYFRYPTIAHVKSRRFIDYYESPLGWLELKASDDYLLSISFVDKPIKGRETNPLLEKSISQLDAYFNGKLKKFNIPVCQKGTKFQQKVWSALQLIPYGETASYKDISEVIKHPKAYRAVGGANNKNKIPIVIPCHRVLGASGKLTGYAGGLSKKEWLLNHEDKNNEGE